jgi:hypothetical protein
MNFTTLGKQSATATVANLESRNGWVKVTFEGIEGYALIKEDKIAHLTAKLEVGATAEAHVDVKEKRDKPGELTAWLDAFGGKPQGKGGGFQPRPPSFKDTAEGYKVDQDNINKRQRFEQMQMNRRTALMQTTDLIAAGKVEVANWEKTASAMAKWLNDGMGVADA